MIERKVSLEVVTLSVKQILGVHFAVEDARTPAFWDVVFKVPRNRK